MSATNSEPTSPDVADKSDNPERTSAVTETAVTQTDQDETSSKSDNLETSTAVTEATMSATNSEPTTPDVADKSDKPERTSAVTETAVTQTGQDETSRKSDNLETSTAVTEATMSATNSEPTSPDVADKSDNPERTSVTETAVTQTDQDETSSKSDNLETSTAVTEATMSATNSEPTSPDVADKSDNPERTSAVTETAVTQTDQDETSSKSDNLETSTAVTEATITTSPGVADKSDKPERTSAVTETAVTQTDQDETSSKSDNLETSTAVTEATMSATNSESTSPGVADKSDKPERTSAVTETAVTQTDQDETSSKSDNLETSTAVTEATMSATNSEYTSPVVADKSDNPERTSAVTETAVTQTDQDETSHKSDNLETDDTTSTDGIGKSDNPDRSTTVTETAITKSGQDESSHKRDNPERTFSIMESIITPTIPNIKTNAPAMKTTRSPTNSDYTTGPDEIYKSDITDQISAITKATFTPSNLKYKTNAEGIYINQNSETSTPFAEINTPMNSEDSSNPDGISKSDIPESASAVTETTTSINSEAPINPERIDKNVDPDSTMAVMGTTISPSNLDYSTKPDSVDKHDNPNNTTAVIITAFALTDRDSTPNPDDIITDVKPDKTMPFTGTTIITNQGDKTARDKDDYGANLDRTTAVTEIAVTHTDPDNIINPHDMIRHDNLDKITDVIGTTITVTNPDVTNNDQFNTVTKATIAEINPIGTTRPDNRNIFPTGTTAVIKAVPMDRRNDTSIPEVNVKNNRPKETTINMDIIRKYIDISGRSPSPNSDDINGLETIATVAKTTIAQTDTQTTFSITTESKPLSNSANFEGDDRPGSNTTKTTAITTDSNLSLPSPNDNDKKRRADIITKITQTLAIETTISPQINKPEHPDIITNKKINLVSDKGTTKENPTNKNTVTQVSTTSSTLSSTTNKITAYSCTIVKPTTQRQVTCYSSPRDATICTTISPQVIINKTTAYVQPENIATLLLYKGIFNFLIIYITILEPCVIVNYLLDIPEEMNLCNKKPVDGIVALQNGSLAVFRDHYYWLLNGTSPPSPQPRKISEGWHIPSPIDTVFSRCNCDGKTFFFKGSQYWRFTNDVMDAGYPKLIVKGFGGLNGKIMGALSVAHYRSRPESKCKKKVVTVNYPVYKPKTLVLRQRRFGRAVQTRPIFRSIRIRQYPVIRITHHSTGMVLVLPCLEATVNWVVQCYSSKNKLQMKQPNCIEVDYILLFKCFVIGACVPLKYLLNGFISSLDCFVFAGVLQPEVKITSYWRGFPKEFNSVISVPNEENGDGYDYYAFAKDNYYNLDVGSRIARPVTVQTGQTVSSAWYKCPAE
ncbi:hypothetical protein E2320_010647 [Naja naja]|nr:hypothetical protein E2320_010647 [Naja naja]